MYMYTYINLEDLRIPLLSSSFVMTYIIDKTLVLIKNNLNYLQDNTFEWFCKKYNRVFHNIIMENARCEDKK